MVLRRRFVSETVIYLNVDIILLVRVPFKNNETYVLRAASCRERGTFFGNVSFFFSAAALGSFGLRV